ncbi:sulfatase family protein [Azohydromonas lata]|uniref:sulfatase family protein n=1 Tax=Azohydromonas lata TaxID=45677 RepID=UPI0008313368|nr:sulfatase [Azohydromonas lata]
MKRQIKPGAQRNAKPVNLTRRRLALALPAAGLARAARAAPPGGARANILFIVADDLDYGIFSLMPKVRRLITESGLECRNHFISLTLCCPSRATMLRGQFGHNHGNLDNHGDYGGFAKFFHDGLESSTFATWLHGAGYRTGMLGKYLNNYPSEDSGSNYIPPGWDTWWVGKGGTLYSQYWYTVNDNGTSRSYGGEPQDHFQNVLLRRAQQFLRTAATDPAGKPFFLYVSPVLPHKPYVAQPQYLDLFPGAQAPRKPNFNEADVSDKPGWVQRLPLLDAAAIRQVDTIYRKRRQCAASLDDMVEALIRTLRSTGQLANTYVIFTSDNGFFHGEHRIPDDKRRAFEENIRAPLVVRGPGIPTGRVVRQLTGNVDFAPTFAELAGVAPPAFVDGRSLVPLFNGAPPARWRQRFLLESQPPQVNSVYLSYSGLRTAARQNFVLYDSGEGEYYDLAADPFQLENRYATMSDALKGELRTQVNALKTSAGAALRRLEEGSGGQQ